MARCVEWLPDIVFRSKSSMEFVAQAELVVSVDPTIRRPRGNSVFFESPFTCTVRIVDDRGKVYSHRIQGWWYPEKAPPVHEEKQWWKFW